MDTSENVEAGIVLVGSLTMAATTYIATLPVPIEIKAPIVALIGSVSAAVLIFWKKRVNTSAPTV